MRKLNSLSDYTVHTYINKLPRRWIFWFSSCLSSSSRPLLRCQKVRWGQGRAFPSKLKVRWTVADTKLKAVQPVHWCTPTLKIRTSFAMTMDTTGAMGTASGETDRVSWRRQVHNIILGVVLFEIACFQSTNSISVIFCGPTEFSRSSVFNQPMLAFEFIAFNRLFMFKVIYPLI